MVPGPAGATLTAIDGTGEKPWHSRDGSAGSTLSQAVSGTQTIQFAGTSTGTVLTFAQPAAIAATLAGFAQGDRMILSGLDSSYTATYTQSTAAAGTLTLTSATRPIVTLTFEGIGFYEHRTAQPGDTPVARFFETRDGSHLYVQSATETASIQATRPDLTYEGIAFYAPPSSATA